MDYAAHRFRSAALSNERDIFVHVPASGRCSALLVFLDSEIYKDRVGAPQVVDTLVERGAIEEPAVVFVSFCTTDARWIECECHPPFASFIVDELLPWLAARFPALGEAKARVLLGLSYTGLAASWVGLERPGAFQAVVSQSGSYWWNDCWLCRQHRIAPGTTLPSFYLDVGTRETAENVTHKDDLVQVASQISAVREFRDVLKAAGATVNYQEFEGGHDGACWTRMLPVALKWAVSSRTKFPTMNLQPLAPAEILALYDAEMRCDPPPEEGMLYEHGGGVVRGSGNFNLIFHSSLSEASADGAIQDQARHFSSPRVELQWKVYGHDLPPDLGTRLVSAGFELSDPETLLALRLGDYRFPGSGPDGVEIRRVCDLEGLRDYIDVGKAVFGKDEPWRFEAYRSRLEDATLGIFVAYAGGSPVSAGRLELPPGRQFASIWGGGTLSAFRGRGIYRSLVHARALEAQGRGYAYLTVDAQETSRPILEGLGFIRLTTIRDYTLHRA
ncbi:MAG TPA: GNAT family N-acetyltransferase [Opitutaceae bacterium]